MRTDIGIDLNIDFSNKSTSRLQEKTLIHSFRGNTDLRIRVWSYTGRDGEGKESNQQEKSNARNCDAEVKTW
jgi:hypothetical protein